MAGQFDIRRSAPGSATWPSSAAPDDDAASLHGTVRSTRLDPVHELGEDEQLVSIPLDMELSQAFSSTSEPRSPSPSSTRTGGRRTSRRAGSTRTASPKGENLGELPVAGPGLDLAAELGRAESKDLVHGFMEDPSRAKSSLEVVDEKELEGEFTVNICAVRRVVLTVSVIPTNQHFDRRTSSYEKRTRLSVSTLPRSSTRSSDTVGSNTFSPPTVRKSRRLPIRGLLRPLLRRKRGLDHNR